MKKKLSYWLRKKKKIKFSQNQTVLKENKRLKTLCKLKLTKTQENCKRTQNVLKQLMHRERLISRMLNLAQINLESNRLLKLKTLLRLLMFHQKLNLEHLTNATSSVILTETNKVMSQCLKIQTEFIKTSQVTLLTRKVIFLIQ